MPPEFRLDTPGTRIAILGYRRGRGEDGWKKRTAHEVISHFFHAVRHDNLRVGIGADTISADTLDRWLPELDDNLRERVEVSGSKVVDSASIEGIGEVNLRVRIREDGGNRSKTVIFVRDAGMMITDKLGSLQLTATTRMIKSFPRRWKGFVAIVECLSRGERSLLREAEAPSHDRVSPDNADEDDRAAVRKALSELGEWVHAAIEKLAAPPEAPDTETLNELADYLPLESDEGATVNEGSTNYEIVAPVKAESAPRNLGARRGKTGARRLRGGGKGDDDDNKPKRRRKKSERRRRRGGALEPVLQPLNDLRRLPHSLQWSDHAVKFAFDKPEGAVRRIELYAKGEMGKDEVVSVERAYHDGRRLKVKDGAVVDFDFDSVVGDRVQLEFKTIRPVSDKRVEITAIV